MDAASPALFMITGVAVSPTRDSDLGPGAAMLPTEAASSLPNFYPEQGHAPSPFDTISSITSDQHPVMDLDLTNHNPEAESDRLDTAEEETEEHTLPLHFLQESDHTPSMLEERTHSMPELNKHDGSTSPEVEPLICQDESQLPPPRMALSQDTPTNGRGHTRHLSLVGVKHFRKKRSSRRQGSVKMSRSRSPPNLPPPPPPPVEKEEEREEEDHQRSLTPMSPPIPEEEAPSGSDSADGHSLMPQPDGHGLMPQLVSSTSLGFTEVMNTILDIDQQLDQLTVLGPAILSPTQAKPSVAIPKRPPPPPGYSSSSGNQNSGTETGSEELDFSCLDDGGFDSLSGSSGEYKIDEIKAEPRFSSSERSTGVAEQVVPPPSGGWITLEARASLEQKPPPVTSIKVEQDVREELLDKNLSLSAPHDKPVPSRISFEDEEEEEEEGAVGAGERPLARDEQAVKHLPKLDNREKRHKQVMFREEVEAIPRYEPRVDKEVDPTEEEGDPMEEEGDPPEGITSEGIPSSIAELKKMLFGNRERGTHTFERDSSTSPRAEAAAEGFNYHYQRDSSISPRTETKSPDESPEDSFHDSSPPVRDEDTGENIYDAPWDQKLASKVVLNRPRMSAIKRAEMGAAEMGAGEPRNPPTVVGAQARSPLPEHIQFSEVSSHEVAMPGDLELRNVHSLERPPRTKKRTSMEIGKETSLLESISSTLQVRSKYGSDSLLNSSASSPEALGYLAPPPRASVSQDSSPALRKKQSKEVMRSARGELAKIRAEHKRDPRISPHTSPKSPLSASNGALPAMVRPVKRVGFANGGHPQPRAARSMEELERRPHTHVSYDRTTQSHIYRSLV